MMTPVRGHGEGSLYHRKADGHRVAAVSMPDGTRPTLSCPHKHRPSDRDCPESKANLAELLRLRDQGAPTGGHTLTLGTYLQRWLRDVRPNLAPATWKKHESIARVHLQPALGRVRLSDLSVGDIRRYLGRHDLDPQSLRHHRATLRRALADALRDGLITRNVAALAEPPKLTRRERTVLDAAQVRVLIEGTRDDRLHALWVLAATTGMREAEMLALTWEDVDLGDSRASVHTQDARRDDVGSSVQVRQDTNGHARRADGPHVTVHSTLHRIDGQWQRRDTKTEKSRRTIPLPPVTVAALRRQMERQREELSGGRSEYRRGSEAGELPRMGDGEFGRGAGAGVDDGWPHEPARDGGLGPAGPDAGPGHGGSRPRRDARRSGQERSRVTSIAVARNRLVFTTEKGYPIHGSNLPKLLHATTDRLGLPRVTPHDLRHSCATILYSMGVPLPTIADILGHSSDRITSQLYRHRVAEVQSAAMERMQEAMDG